MTTQKAALPFPIYFIPELLSAPDVLLILLIDAAFCLSPLLNASFSKGRDCHFGHCYITQGLPRSRPSVNTGLK